MYQVQDYIHEPLYVVVPIFNSPRYKTRYKHFQRFAKHVKDSGGVLVTVEAAFGERQHFALEGKDQHGQLAYPAAPTKEVEFHKARSTEHHIVLTVRTDDEVWIKENLINIAIQRLPVDWKYVAWVDGDVHFARPNWVGETIHKLQHFKVVQMWSEALDLTPEYVALPRFAESFMSSYAKGLPLPEYFNGEYPYYGKGQANGRLVYHPGYAWAARREAIDALGGLFEVGILGSGDNHMAHALIGGAERTLHPQIHQRYKEHVREWQYRAETFIRRNVGCVSGLLLHHWHGKKVNRGYRDRWKILVDNAYNPDLDIKKDWQGLIQLVDRGDLRSVALRDQIRTYFKSRQEDSIDV